MYPGLEELKNSEGIDDMKKPELKLPVAMAQQINQNEDWLRTRVFWFIFQLGTQRFMYMCGLNRSGEEAFLRVFDTD